MTIVVKISGHPIDRPEESDQLWKALASVSERKRIVVVHGGGTQVDARLAALGHTTTRVQGLRVTPEDQIGPVAGVLAGEVNRTLVSLLRNEGLDAVGISAGDGGMIKGKRQQHDGVDLGCVGEVVGGSARLIASLHAGGFVPVVSPIAFGRDGGLLNINADDVAAGLARTIGASRLVLLTEVPGVLDGAGQVVPAMDHEMVESLIADGVIVGGMAVKARAALRAHEMAGVTVRVGGWFNAESLIMGDGAGTSFGQLVPGALRRVSV